MYVSEDESLQSMEGGSLEEKPVKAKAKRGRSVKAKTDQKQKKKQISSDEEELKPSPTKWKKNLKRPASTSSESDLEDTINTIISLSQSTDLWFSRFHGINYLHIRNKRKNKNISLNEFETRKLMKLNARIKSIFTSASNI